MPTKQTGLSPRESSRRHGIRLAALTALVAAAVAAVVVVGAWWAGTRGTTEPAAGPTPSESPSSGSPSPTSPWHTSPPVGRVTGWQDLDPGPLTPRRDAAVVATDRWVVVVGGRAAGRDLTDAAAFDVRSGTWQRLADVPAAGAGADTGAWTGSQVVVAGQHGAAALDPATGRWTTLAGPPFPAGRRVAAGGSVITVDVEAGGTTVPLARLDPGSGTWEALPAVPLAEVHDLLDAGGRLVTVGPAARGSTALSALALSGSQWRDLGLPALPWQFGHLAAGDAVSLYVWAGGSPGAERPTDHGVAVALGSGRWRQTADLPAEWWECYAAAASTGGELLVDACSTVLTYEPASDRVTTLGLLPPSAQSTARLVVVAGHVYRWGPAYCSPECTDPPPAVAFTRW